MDEAQVRAPPLFLADALGAGGVSGAFSQLEVGALWSALGVDGEAAMLEWTSLPAGRWVHVHLTAGQSFADDASLMAKKLTQGQQECVKSADRFPLGTSSTAHSSGVLGVGRFM